jgi:membrane protein implicated in regulation of membrane protease activity
MNTYLRVAGWTAIALFALAIISTAADLPAAALVAPWLGLPALVALVVIAIIDTSQRRQTRRRERDHEPSEQHG